MSNEATSSNAALRAELIRKRDALRENIQAAQKELAKVEYALNVLTNDLFSETPVVEPLVLTVNGTIRNLPERVIGLLEDTGHSLSISEMTEVWFDYTMPMTPAELKRRLSVTTSAIYRKAFKDGLPLPIAPSGKHNPNREIYWSLPQWMDGDKVKEQYKPHGPIMNET